MVRKKQENSESGAVLNREKSRRDCSLFIGKEDLRKLYQNAKPMPIDMAIEQYATWESDVDESEIELFEKLLSLLLPDLTSVQ